MFYFDWEVVSQVLECFCGREDFNLHLFAFFFAHTHDALIARPSKSNEREQLTKYLVLLRFTCPRGTQFGGLDEGRGQVGASSLAIAEAVSLRLIASALLALCLLFRGGGVLCRSLGTLMRVSRPVCLEDSL